MLRLRLCSEKWFGIFPSLISCIASSLVLQFGHQTNEKDCEVLSLLANVRPGNGYKPNFPMFTKMEVNGANESPIFSFLKAALPYPSGTASLLFFRIFFYIFRTCPYISAKFSVFVSRLFPT
jgi:hypothetical protein